MAKELELWTRARRIDAAVVKAFVDFAAGDGAGKEALRADLRADLHDFAVGLAGGSEPGPVERELIETASLCWFWLRLAEFQVSAGDHQGVTLHQSEHAEKRVERAHRRLLATLRTLAQVRKLGVPTIQVNVANQQVNLAGTS